MHPAARMPCVRDMFRQFQMHIACIIAWETAVAGKTPAKSNRLFSQSFQIFGTSLRGMAYKTHPAVAAMPKARAQGNWLRRP